MASLLRSLAAFAFVFPSVSALQVTPGSSCASVCIDHVNGDAADPKSSNTKVSDVVCNDVDYWSTPTGVKYRTCVECLQNSTRVDAGENDVAWYLYNIRYAIDVCLFAFPNNTDDKSASSPCALDQTCGPLRTALESGALNPNNGSQYGYCTADSNAFSGQAVSNCAQCFQATSGQKYFSNFISALSIGCTQKPNPGTVVGIAGSLFTSTAISMVTPAANATSLPDGQSATTTMTTGTIVGIVVGAGLLFLSGVALLIVYWRRQRRFSRDDDNAASSYHPSKPSPSYSSTITSHHHLPSYTTDYKSGLPAYEPPHGIGPGIGGGITATATTAQGDYQNNADYYDRMADVHQLQRPADVYAAAAPRDLSALPTHHAYVPRAPSRTSRHESPNPNSRNPAPRAAADTQQPSPPQVQAAAAAPPPARESVRIPPPPARHAVSVARSSYMAQKNNQAEQPAAAAAAVSVPPPPPPPPPARPVVTNLILPTVPRVRLPKKYTPPQIAVVEATPIEQPDHNISLPFSMREERFKRDGGEEGNIDRVERDRTRTTTLVPVKRPNNDNYQEMPIGSGKSILYGI